MLLANGANSEMKKNVKYEGHRILNAQPFGWAYLLSKLRLLSRRLGLANTLHKLRQLIHFGPWRIIPIYLIRTLRKPLQESGNLREPSLLGAIDASSIADEIHNNSVAVAGVLPTEFVNDLRRITDNLPFNEYHLVHQVNASLLRLTEDSGIKSVLRAYLKCEPVLLEASLFVSRPEHNLRDHEQHSFHFDYAGWQSLNVFVYLTDVTENSSYHIVARGSHRSISVQDILQGSLTAEEGTRRYGTAIQHIIGPAGTVFFENTEAFHRRHKGNERRVMLNLLYASHRSILSHGRASKRQINARNRAFEIASSR